MIRILRVAFAALSALVCGVVSAGSPQLVSNINTMAIGVGSNPAFLGTAGNWTYFMADDQVHGHELWKTDGTPANTTLVKDINPGPQASLPANFVAVGNVAYFSAQTETDGRELWITDGTTDGTREVANLNPGSQPSDVGVVGAMGPVVLVIANAGSGNGLYRTDGTADGTIKLSDAGVPPNAHPRSLLVAGNGKAYYTGFSQPLGSELWVTDGTVSGTHRLDDGATGDPVYNATAFVKAGNYVYFTGSNNSGSGIWRVRLSDDTVERVTTGMGIEGGFNEEGQPLIALGDHVIFASSGTGQQHVYSTTGPGAILELSPFNIWNGNSQINPHFTVLGDRVIYVTNADNNFIAVWFTTDGTPAGTTRLFDTALGSVNAGALGLGRIGPYYYMYTASGTALVRTDGTTAGSILLPAVPGFSPSAGSQHFRIAGDASAAYFDLGGIDGQTQGGSFAVVRYDPAANAFTVLKKSAQANVPADVFAFGNGKLFFSPYVETTGYEPWVSDGSVAGTKLLLNVSVELTERGSNPDGLVAFGDRVYFSADDGIAGREVWRSDGTAAGTQLASDIVAGPLGSEPQQIFSAGNSLLTFAHDSPSSGGSVLWRFDPSSQALEKIPDTGPLSPSAFNTATANSITYFPASDVSARIEPWRSDGTTAGTRRVADIAPGFIDSNPSFFTELGGTVYFIVRQFGSGNDGFGLFRTDGTEVGTQRLMLHPLSFNPPFLTKIGNALYYVAADASGAAALFRSDGTAAGTTLVKAFTEFRSLVGVVNGRLLFLVQVPGSVNQYWTYSPGETSFTPILTTASIGQSMVGANGALAFFSATDSTHGLGPWVTDGTAAGTKPLVDVPTGSIVAPTWLADFRGMMIFTARESQTSTDRRYWKSDGTPAGTVAIAPMGAGRFVNMTTRAVTLGNRLFFAVSDPVVGTELYALENDAPVAANDSATTPAGQAVTVDVLANDSDADGSVDRAHVVVVTAAQHGTTSVSNTGQITYTPAANFSGADSFAYTVPDNQGRASAAATVSVTVSAPPGGGGNNNGGGGGDSGGGGGGGGGALDWLFLAVLATLLSVRRAVVIRAAGCRHQSVQGTNTSYP